MERIRLDDKRLTHEFDGAAIWRFANGRLPHRGVIVAIPGRDGFADELTLDLQARSLRSARVEDQQTHDFGRCGDMDFGLEHATQARQPQAR